MANGIAHEKPVDGTNSLWVDMFRIVRDIIFFASVIVGAGWAWWNLMDKVNKANDTNAVQDMDIGKVKADASELKTDVAILKRDVVIIREDQKKAYDSQVETSKDIKELLRRVK